MTARTWTISQAKVNLVRLIERAQAEGPQTITRHGRSLAVLVSPQDSERRRHRTGTLATFFAASPLRGSRLSVERTGKGWRTVDL